MFTNHPYRQHNRQHRQQRGALKINTAQAIIILIALGCAGVVFNVYQQSHETPIAPVPSPAENPKLVRYDAEMKAWQAKLTQDSTTNGITLIWPYLGQDNEARVDLPKQQPVTLAAWDSASVKNITEKAYARFVSARKKAKVANSQGCLVHVFQPSPNGDTMEEVAIGSASGVTSPQPE